MLQNISVNEKRLSAHNRYSLRSNKDFRKYKKTSFNLYRLRENIVLDQKICKYVIYKQKY